MKRIQRNLSPWLCRWLLGLGLFIEMFAEAHGPYDHSSRLIVGETQLEMTLTMGSDATRDFLTMAGLPPEEVRQILSMTSGQSGRVLPVEMGSKLFITSAGGETLVAEAISAVTEGLETLFTMRFSRPPGGKLELRAIYFNGIEPMKQGAFVAVDDHDQSLGASFLSRANDSVELQLPVKTSGAPIPTLETSVPILVQASQSAVVGSAGKSGKFSFIFWFPVVAVAIVLWLIWRRGWRPSP